MNKFLLAIPLLATSVFAQDHTEHEAPCNCDTPPVVITPPNDAPASIAYDKWGPTRDGECTREQHNAYSEIGPDGKRYPVWHPPVDPSGCFFGHEHGDNPKNSPLMANRQTFLFGYVNEQHANQDVKGHRHEDHVGHKVFILDQHKFNSQGIVPAGYTTVCSVVTKLHQGTHSPDAFANNLHEQMSVMSCDDGIYADVQLMSAIGPASQFQQQCGPQSSIGTNPAVPVDSPTNKEKNKFTRGGSMGNRFLPTNYCANLKTANLFEIWKTQNTINSPVPIMSVATAKKPSVVTNPNSPAFQFAWYWGVGNPARYFDPSQPNSMGRTIDLCWQARDGKFLIAGAPCQGSIKAPGLRQIASGDPNSIQWNDPRSPFRGDNRSVRFDSFIVKYPAGATEWYTDALGENASWEPFPGSIKQIVHNKSYSPISKSSQPALIGGNTPGKNFNAPGVHAPN